MTPTVGKVRLGSSGLYVSRLALGCMSFGEPERGGQQWTLDEAQSRPFLEQALQLGMTFWDTANSYSAGSSEEIVGRAIRDLGCRDEVVLATKVFMKMHDGPGGRGLSRKAIFDQVDASLRRLGTDYVDLYQIHRWDPYTPIEETMEALHDVVKAGKARYLGASSMQAWQFAKAQYTADLGGWTRFVSMQDQYNLLQREEEREMLPFCADQGVGVLPWSPLARGRLTRPWDESTHRQQLDDRATVLYADSDRQIVEAVAAVAGRHEVPMATVALAWVLRRPEVVAPIVGVTKQHHLTDAVAALSLQLTEEDVQELEAGYYPRQPTGF